MLLYVKSYLGVCLVLAMDKIRRYLKDNGINTGPIVVLSYKNHALDEFLMDVLNGHGSLKPGELIRCGKSDTEELSNFSEKRHPEEGICQKELSNRVKLLRKVRKFALETWSCAMHLESTFATESLWIPRGQLLGVGGIATFGDSKIEYQPSTAAIVNALAWLTKVVEDLPYCEVARADTIHDCLFLPSPDDDLNLLSIDIEDDEHEGYLQYFEAIAKMVPHMLHSVSENSLTEWIKNLIFAAEHWNRRVSRDEHFVFIVDQFLRGNHPPPRCCGKTPPHGEQCFESVDPNWQQWTTYCSRNHACLAPMCGRKRVMDKSKFCKQHRCTYDDNCGKMRRESSRFCGEHTCMGCLLAGKNPLKAGQPFACEDHRCQQGDCHNLRVTPHLFCEIHCCVQCLADGKPSFSPTCNVNTRVCHAHKCCVADCMELKFGDASQSCLYHKCIDCDSPVHAACLDSHLCTNHKCTTADCIRRRTKNSNYCKTHTCRVCVVEEALSVSPIVDRNCCSNHLLCNWILRNGRLCNDRAVLPGLFCADHVNSVSNDKSLGDDPTAATQAINQQNRGDGICWGVKKKKNERCKCKGWNLENREKPFYCNDHKDQAPVETKEVLDSELNDEDLDEEVLQEEEVDVEMMEWIALIGLPNQTRPAVGNNHFFCVKANCSAQDCPHFSYQPEARGPWRCPLHLNIAPLPRPPVIAPLPPPGYIAEGQGYGIGGEEETKEGSIGTASTKISSKKAASQASSQINEEDNAGVILAAAGVCVILTLKYP